MLGQIVWALKPLPAYPTLKITLPPLGQVMEDYLQVELVDSCLNTLIRLYT